MAAAGDKEEVEEEHEQRSGRSGRSGRSRITNKARGRAGVDAAGERTGRQMTWSRTRLVVGLSPNLASSKYQ